MPKRYVIELDTSLLFNFATQESKTAHIAYVWELGDVSYDGKHRWPQRRDKYVTLVAEADSMESAAEQVVQYMKYLTQQEEGADAT